jgi:hypothetical protein
VLASHHTEAKAGLGAGTDVGAARVPMQGAACFGRRPSEHHLRCGKLHSWQPDSRHGLSFAQTVLYAGTAPAPLPPPSEGAAAAAGAVPAAAAAPLGPAAPAGFWGLCCSK